MEGTWRARGCARVRVCGPLLTCNQAHFVETVVDAATGTQQLDGWPIGTGWRYPQPRTVEQRMAHAREFRSKFGFPAELEVRERAMGVVRFAHH